MADPNQIPYLMKLIDDPSDTVRQAVHNELRQYGPELRSILDNSNFIVTPSQFEQLVHVLRPFDSSWLQHAFFQCLDTDDQTQRLEQALSVLADFLCHRNSQFSLSELLDSLAHNYDKRHNDRDVLRLSDFLFVEQGLSGDRDDYYNPHNSNLISVIERRRGLPISLCLIYMLVGSRLGLDIQGCGFPGHFLARITTDNGPYLVDCFEKGRTLSDTIIIQHPQKKWRSMLSGQELVASSEEIIIRVLRNLITASDQADNSYDQQLYEEILDEFEARVGATPGEGEDSGLSML